MKYHVSLEADTWGHYITFFESLEEAKEFAQEYVRRKDHGSLEGLKKEEIMQCQLYISWGDDNTISFDLA